MTEASTSGQPPGSHVQVNSVTLVHSSGVDAQRPLTASKHQPQPDTGVQLPQVVYWLQLSP